MADITAILHAIDQGDPGAASQLLPLVYSELRQLAARKLAHEPAGQTLDATALVHEAYLRLAAPAKPLAEEWDGRAHFFAAAAEAMRRILVERARRKHARKHGGGRTRADIDLDALPAPDAHEDLLALDEALTRLAERDAQAAELVKLRHFAGLTVDQAADVLGVSPRTVNRLWTYAKAWLYRELNET